jgi:hypothetical protein
MKKILSRGLVFAGMLSVPVPVTIPDLPSAPDLPSVQPDYRNDPRLASLKKFFQEGDCPAQDFSEEFLRAADQHNLDWRLLPSISVVESGGGRDAPNNNLFGWDSGKAMFTSARAAIHEVATSLANSKLYRDKDVDEILKTYNPNANYSAIVKSVMRRISPSENDTSR